MEFATSPIPQISISLAPAEEPTPELNSRFKSLVISTQDDGFRPTHLTPPPTVTNFKRPRSPLNPGETGRGLSKDRFNELLSNSAKGYSSGKRELDLRKEIALKTHKNKQVERRALFLSKLQAPPSPTAATTPKTPPESPAIFHYHLPSPGLVSPLALFESLNEAQEGIPAGWVEQVDFRLKTVERQPARGVPSLDQISARYTPPHARKADPHVLPGLSPAPAPASAPGQTRPSVGIGRLRMPLRIAAPHPQPVAVTHSAGAAVSFPGDAQPRALRAQPPPRYDTLPEIRVTTLVVPHTRTVPPVELTEQNLSTFNCQGKMRDQRATDMLSKLRRRTLSSECLFVNDTGATSPKEWRRRSAPADLMPLHARAGFAHPVLALPGGF